MKKAISIRTHLIVLFFFLICNASSSQHFRLEAGVVNKFRSGYDPKLLILSKSEKSVIVAFLFLDDRANINLEIKELDQEKFKSVTLGKCTLGKYKPWYTNEPIYLSAINGNFVCFFYDFTGLAKDAASFPVIGVIVNQKAEIIARREFGKGAMRSLVVSKSEDDSKLVLTERSAKPFSNDDEDEEEGLGMEVEYMLYRQLDVNTLKDITQAELTVDKITYGDRPLISNSGIVYHHFYEKREESKSTFYNIINMEKGEVLENVSIMSSSPIISCTPFLREGNIAFAGVLQDGEKYHLFYEQFNKSGKSQQQSVYKLKSEEAVELNAEFIDYRKKRFQVAGPQTLVLRYHYEDGSGNMLLVYEASRYFYYYFHNDIVIMKVSKSGEMTKSAVIPQRIAYENDMGGFAIYKNSDSLRIVHLELKKPNAYIGVNYDIDKKKKVAVISFPINNPENLTKEVYSFKPLWGHYYLDCTSFTRYSANSCLAIAISRPDCKFRMIRFKTE